MQRRNPWFYLAMLVTAPVVLLVQVWPFHPHTRSGWLLFLALSAPLCMVGALLERSIYSNPVAAKIDAHTSAKTVSALRMLYMFAAVALVVILAWLGQLAWHRWVDSAL